MDSVGKAQQALTGHLKKVSQGLHQTNANNRENDAGEHHVRQQYGGGPERAYPVPTKQDPRLPRTTSRGRASYSSSTTYRRNEGPEMSGKSADDARAGLTEWADDAQAVAADLADMLGIEAADYAADPLAALGGWQDHVSRLPFDEFEDEDWQTLHSDLASYLADVLTRRADAVWQVVDDPGTPRGFRYLLFARSPDGRILSVDPHDIVLTELQNPPIEIIRMIAGAETALGISRTPPEE